MYEKCILHELTLRAIAHRKQVGVPPDYKGLKVETELRLGIG